MDGLSELEYPAEDRARLPIGLRRIYFRDLAGLDSTAGAHLVDKLGGTGSTPIVGQKRIARIWAEQPE